MDNQQQWIKLAGRYRLAVNLAWVLQKARYPVLAAASLLVLLMLVERSWNLAWCSDWSVWFVPAPFLLLLPAYYLARKKFIALPQALVAIEYKLGLHNALSCAAQGTLKWPAFPGSIHALWHWRFWSFVPSLLIAPAMVYAALFIPQSETPKLVASTQMPLDWQNIQSSVEQLRASGAVDDSSLLHYEQKLSALQSLPQQNWYDHSAMEAGDNLKSQQQQQLAQLNSALEKAGNSLQSMLKEPGPVNEQNLQQAIDELQNSPLKPNAQLMEKLAELQPQNAQLNKEQLQQLQQALNENAEKLKPLLDAMQQLQAQQGQGGQDGNGNAQAGEGDNAVAGAQQGANGGAAGPGQEAGALKGAGQGGHSDSPPEDTAQNTTDTPSTLKAGGPNQYLTPADLRRASLGDLLETKSHQPQASSDNANGSAGANLQQAAESKHNKQSALHPDEQRALRRFFGN